MIRTMEIQMICTSLNKISINTLSNSEFQIGFLLTNSMAACLSINGIGYQVDSGVECLRRFSIDFKNGFIDKTMPMLTLKLFHVFYMNEMFRFKKQIASSIYVTH